MLLYKAHDSLNEEVHGICIAGINYSQLIVRSGKGVFLEKTFHLEMSAGFR